MKKAILVVSFGTSHINAIEKNIESCEKKIKERLENYSVYKAFTSNVIIKILNKKYNIFIDNPMEALEKLYQKGYDEVIVQPLHIIEGNEYTKLKEQVECFRSKFNSIVVGNPLLTNNQDYDEVIEAIKYQIPELKENEAILFMGHGTSHKSHCIYSNLEIAMKENGIRGYMGTVEGDFNLDDVIKNLKKDTVSKVLLMPFMLVAGKHTIEDMASVDDKSWNSILKRNGFETEVYLKGLGENPRIQDKFANHVARYIK